MSCRTFWDAVALVCQGEIRSSVSTEIGAAIGIVSVAEIMIGGAIRTSNGSSSTGIRCQSFLCGGAYGTSSIGVTAQTLVMSRIKANMTIEVVS